MYNQIYYGSVWYHFSFMSDSVFKRNLIIPVPRLFGYIINISTVLSLIPVYFFQLGPVYLD